MGKKNKKGKSSKPPLDTPPLDTPPLDTQVVQSDPSVDSLLTVSDEEPYDHLKPKRHPFLRVDKDSAVHDRMWLITVGRAFPLECAFVGALILTEPWLAYAVFDDGLWNEIVNLRKGGLPEIELWATLIHLWAVLSSTNLEYIHNLCREKGIYLFRRGKPKRRWSFTIIKGGALGPVRQVQYVEFKFQLEPFERILHLKDKVEDHVRNTNPRGRTLEAFDARNAILELFQLGCLGAMLCERTSSKSECACPLHIHLLYSTPRWTTASQVFSNLPWGPTAPEMSKRWAKSGLDFYDFNFAREVARKVARLIPTSEGLVESAFDIQDVPALDPTRKHLSSSISWRQERAQVSITVSGDDRPDSVSVESGFRTTPILQATVPHNPWASLVIPPFSTPAPLPVTIVHGQVHPRPRKGVDGDTTTPFLKEQESDNAAFTDDTPPPASYLELPAAAGEGTGWPSSEHGDNPKAGLTR